MNSTAAPCATARFMGKIGIAAAASLLVAVMLLPLIAKAQTTSTVSTRDTVSSRDRWLHIRVTNPSKNEESVRVNVPLELAERVLPTINKDRLHGGRVRFDDIDCHGVDLRALAEAVRAAKDGEFVIVQNRDSDVRIAKRNGTVFVHVFAKNRPRKSQVEVKVPMTVVDALFSGSKDELDLVAALHALSTQGDTELVSVKDEENTVRVWLDSKNITD
jgi:ABC-type oligopeptide transport system substrate-binding subunit